VRRFGRYLKKKCLTDRFDKAGTDIQLGLQPYKLQDEDPSDGNNKDNEDIPFQSLTVDGAIQGQFETIVSYGSVTDSVQMEANIGLLKVGVEITDK
jgi:hypothetical protein